MADTTQRPEWMEAVGRANFFNRYSEFENKYGETWAFLFNLETDMIFLTGEQIGWEINKLPGWDIEGWHKHDAIEVITVAGDRFVRTLKLEERMWLAACLRVASETRKNYLSAKK